MDNLKSIATSLTNIDKILTHHLSGPVAETLDIGRCWRWDALTPNGQLISIPNPSIEPLSHLIGLADQIKLIEHNTRLLLSHQAANNVLLTGARGCGKSSVIRGIFLRYANRGLRLIETDVTGLALLPSLLPLITHRPEKFIIYCDDLSFTDNTHLFNRVKSNLEGTLATGNSNWLVYATSNRRNIIADNFSDNLAPLSDTGDIQPMETADEKMALADRFGLWVPFFAPDAKQYQTMVKHWLGKMNVKPTDTLIIEAQAFADARGSRNGRIARQFAITQAKP